MKRKPIVLLLILIAPALTVSGQEKDKQNPVSEAAAIQSAKMKLLGKWQGKIKFDVSKLSKEEKTQIEAAKAFLKDLKMELEFKDDGSAVVSLEILGQNQKQEGKWEVTKAAGKTITLSAPSPGGNKEPVEIVFDGNDAFVMKPPKDAKDAPAGMSLHFTRK